MEKNWIELKISAILFLVVWCWHIWLVCNSGWTLEEHHWNERAKTFCSPRTKLILPFLLVKVLSVRIQGYASSKVSCIIMKPAMPGCKSTGQRWQSVSWPLGRWMCSCCSVPTCDAGIVPQLAGWWPVLLGQPTKHICFQHMQGAT